MTPSRPRAVPGGTSALKPPQRQPIVSTPARPAPAAPAAVTVDTPRPTAPAADVDALPPPPPATRRQPREQLNTKIRVDLRARLNAFVTRHESTVQGVLEAALDEYMARRGWSWDDYNRRS